MRLGTPDEARLSNGPRSILSALADNQVHNVTFTVAPLDTGDGLTTYQGGDNFLVQINASEADDPTYSRIYLASTFIHEASTPSSARRPWPPSAQR